ncbi:MAG: shikimate dehydrogenase, partial [Burkholderiales bacterium]
MADRYAVIGNPVAHSKSPWIHAEFARATAQDLEYSRLEAPLDGFARTLDGFRALGGRGANVTLPFKQEAFRYATRCTERAQSAGAVNTLRFEGDDVLGDNTDGVGLLRDLTVNAGCAIAGKRVLLMGAGGAAQGVLGPLLAARPVSLVIANRTADRARALARRFPGAVGGGY